MELTEKERCNQWIADHSPVDIIANTVFVFGSRYMIDGFLCTYSVSEFNEAVKDKGLTFGITIRKPEPRNYRISPTPKQEVPQTMKMDYGFEMDSLGRLSKTHIQNMKKYIGTKTVHAEPMTYGEAHKEGLIPENAYVCECDSDNGYKVVYADGYTSWSPADVFEEAYKIAETPLNRIRIEEAELLERYEKLTEFQHSDRYDDLDNASKAMLEAQCVAIHDYLHILGCRDTKMESGNGGLYDQRFAVAIALLEAGHAVRRSGWNGKNLMVFKQVPASIKEDIIPKMQSLPEDAKHLILANTGHIDYTSQCLIYNAETGRADSWVPSISDVFAQDWELVL